MKKYIQIGEWIFLVTGIKGIRVGKHGKFGDDYDATGIITIANGDVNVEGLLARVENGIGKSDITALVELVKMMEYSEYITSTYVSGECVKRIVKIKK
jgi:hypothetical protein